MVCSTRRMTPIPASHRDFPPTTQLSDQLPPHQAPAAVLTAQVVTSSNCMSIPRPGPSHGRETPAPTPPRYSQRHHRCPSLHCPPTQRRSSRLDPWLAPTDISASWKASNSKSLWLLGRRPMLWRGAGSTCCCRSLVIRPSVIVICA